MNILVAIDGSTGAEKAVRFASKLAKDSKSSMAIISVVPHVPTTKEAIITLLKEEIGNPEKAAEKYLEKGEEIAKKYGISPAIVLTEGDPNKEIRKAAERFDLLVVGSCGKGKVDSFLLGSVSSNLVKTAKVPVLVVR